MDAALQRIIDDLEANREPLTIQVPSRWIDPEHAGIQTVDAYDFFISSLEAYRDRPAQHPRSTGGQWIKDATIYSMLIRSSTTFDFNQNHQQDIHSAIGETGSFLKTILLLKYLAHMGVDVLYLLPIMRYSRSHRKGELGSPYAITNFYALDTSLKDPLLSSDCSIEDEFKALVFAAHTWGMRVIIDIIPRTNAIESDFIASHPEWFYWIKKDALETYHAPHVAAIDGSFAPTDEHMAAVYHDPQVKNFIRQFQFNPKQLDPQGWPAFYAKHHDQANFLNAVENEYGLTIAPAFSDWINDNQPIWNDITYFRMYYDHPRDALPYLDQPETQAPYILFDVAKSSMHPGEIPNEELWTMIIDILPYYQKTFGIDGARIDMGHALPIDLVDRMIQRARLSDPDFCLIAEELELKNAKAAFQRGYNAIIGDGFIKEPRSEQGLLKQFFQEIQTLPVPVLAMCESHDTPRIAARSGYQRKARLCTVLNFFAGNGACFINSGQELYETQPMNLGLDAKQADLESLDPSHPYYRKLALFDRFGFDYPRNDTMIPLIAATHRIRHEQAIEDIQVVDSDEQWFIERIPRERDILWVMANLDFSQSQAILSPCLFPFQMLSSEHQALETQGLHIKFAAGEVKLIAEKK